MWQMVLPHITAIKLAFFVALSADSRVTYMSVKQCSSTVARGDAIWT
jgi:hypothetical protein